MSGLQRLLAGLLLCLSVHVVFPGRAQSDEDDKAATVAGVRGLDKSGAAVDTGARDYKAIDRLEAVKITPEEQAAFLKEGKLL